MLFLTEQDVLKALSGRQVYREAVGVIEQVFREQASGSAFCLKRQTMEHPDFPGHLWHNIRILPGMLPGAGAAAVRVYSGYRGTNRSEVICLFKWEDMEMIAIISDYHLHAIRTAAPYGLAAQFLAPPDAKQIGIIGTGRYARGLVQAVSAVRDIQRIKAYSRSAENRGKFCAEMKKVLGIEVLPAGSGKEVLQGADIVITATSGNTVVLKGDWLVPGTLVLSLAPGEFDERTVERSRVFLAGTDQVLGDTPPRKPFSSLIASGKFTREDVAGEFHEVVAGRNPGRLSDDEIILFESPGMGILDAGIAHWVYRLAKEKGVGTELPFGQKMN